MLHDLRPPDEEEEEQLEAASVAQLARAQGGGSSGVLDALEAAEAAHEAAHDSKGATCLLRRARDRFEVKVGLRLGTGLGSRLHPSGDWWTTRALWWTCCEAPCCLTASAQTACFSGLSITLLWVCSSIRLLICWGHAYR